MHMDVHMYRLGTMRMRFKRELVINLKQVQFFLRYVNARKRAPSHSRVPMAHRLWEN